MPSLICSKILAETKAMLGENFVAPGGFIAKPGGFLVNPKDFVEIVMEINSPWNNYLRYWLTEAAKAGVLSQTISCLRKSEYTRNLYWDMHASPYTVDQWKSYLYQKGMGAPPPEHNWLGFEDIVRPSVVASQYLDGVFGQAASIVMKQMEWQQQQLLRHGPRITLPQSSPKPPVKAGAFRRGFQPTTASSAPVASAFSPRAASRVRGLRGFGQAETMTSLPAPATPSGLPHGLQRGGIFEAAWVPGQYIDQAQKTVPTDSPPTYVLGNVLGAPIRFAPEANQVVEVGTQRAVGRFHGFGMVVGSPPPPPMAVRSYAAPRLPHGTTEGGIFGPGQYNTVPTTAVPMASPWPQTTYVNRPPGLGAGPDGLGRCPGCR